ncbi:hypothetical protein SUGI_1487740 [Cryptomeria japonica]|uniref:Uncharacterized protein n=1 Tax=Cryptomeria japonica TaxID=3369 RepID=A0AAD3NUB7_CRYJA|nr:hypothetical protein SUGI_1487740 [Cryptomeria japonica]
MVDEYKNMNNDSYGEDEEGEIDIGQPSNHYAPDKIVGQKVIQLKMHFKVGGGPVRARRRLSWTRSIARSLFLKVRPSLKEGANLLNDPSRSSKILILRIGDHPVPKQTVEAKAAAGKAGVVPDPLVSIRELTVDVAI